MKAAAGPHAGVSLDLTGIEAINAADLLAGHAEPIPWKTGQVGVVAPLDGSADGGQRTTDGGQRTADGGQRTTDGGRRTADGGRRTADSRQRPADSGCASGACGSSTTGPRTHRAARTPRVACR